MAAENNTPIAIMDTSAGATDPGTAAHFPIGTPDRVTKRKEAPKPTSPGVIDHNGRYLSKFEATARAGDGSPLLSGPGMDANAVEVAVWREIAKIRGIFVQEFIYVHSVIKEVKEGHDAGPMPRVV